MKRQSGRNRMGFKLVSLEKLLAQPTQQTTPYTRSPWELDAQNLTLNLYELSSTGASSLIYSVDLERCENPASVLEWIVQVLEKAWASDRVLAGLVRDLYLYLGYEICCGRGINNVGAVVRKNMTEANILRGKRHKRQGAKKAPRGRVFRVDGAVSPSTIAQPGS